MEKTDLRFGVYVRVRGCPDSSMRLYEVTDNLSLADELACCLFSLSLYDKVEIRKTEISSIKILV